MRRRLKGQKSYRNLILAQLVILGFLLCLLVLHSGNESSQLLANSHITGLQVVDVPNENLLSSPDSTELVINKSFLMGNSVFSNHEDFTVIEEARYGSVNLPINRTVYRAFKEMYAAAARDGVYLRVLSAARNWSRQRTIWENRLIRLGFNPSIPFTDKRRIAIQALQFVSMPGISRHHWGTELDLNSLETGYFDSGEGHRILSWLEQHAAEYGFFQAYTDPSGSTRTGFSYEPWHWSYQPLASKYYRAYLELVSYTDLTGFLGSELASELKVIELYVEGVNPLLK